MFCGSYFFWGFRHSSEVLQNKMSCIPQCLNMFSRSRYNVIYKRASSLKRAIHTGSTLEGPRQLPPVQSANKSPMAVATKYKSFEDASSPVVLDMLEEAMQQVETAIDDFQDDEFEGINLKRGVTGVYDIEDLVSLLTRENAKDIFVAALPSDVRFSTHICLVSGKSRRHSLALAEFVRRIYKKKRGKYDMIPKIEGRHSKEWIALDLGNISLHIFDPAARKKYNLETLWAVGEDYDPEFLKSSTPLTPVDNHQLYLQDLIPINHDEKKND